MHKQYLYVAIATRQPWSAQPLGTLQLRSAVNLGASEDDEALLRGLRKLVENFEAHDAEDDAAQDCSTCPSEDSGDEEESDIEQDTPESN